MHFLRIESRALHYRAIGLSPSKPSIVFINSLGTDFRIWDEVVERVAPDYGIILYDKRGHGLSDSGNAPYSINDHVDDLIALLSHLQQGPVIVWGLSVGGLIAQGLYARRPDLVRAMVLSNTAHKIGTAEMWNARIAQIEAGGIESLLGPIMERWFTPRFREAGNALYAGCCTMLIQQSVTGYNGTCAAIRDADFTDTAREIKVPVLCVAGDADGSTPAELVKSTAGLIPGSRFAVIENAAHIPCIEQPDAYVAAVRGFLSSLPEN
ncbi:3-oxoadipate enol-lactonase [Allorhizobium undicola]|uniref:3-oxoadipate enol-lactonase n=1 Tax=Allorhizobium undicola TaxID=78527 RepID=UPI00047FAA62|nr:3-oxoadipate enol-lactonase [Allorhizobium undicola]